jgi:hypothetical protein
MQPHMRHCDRGDTGAVATIARAIEGANGRKPLDRLFLLPFLNHLAVLGVSRPFGGLTVSPYYF